MKNKVVINIREHIRFDGNIGLLKVKVTPSQSKNEFFSVLEDGTLKIRIKAPAEKGRANKELISFVSSELEIDKSKVSIIIGEIEQLKILKIKK